MPFNKYALIELLKREKINQRELSKRLEELFIQNRSKFHSKRQITFAQSYLSELISGKRDNPSTTAVDILYLYSKERKYEDLKFYCEP